MKLILKVLAVTVVLYLIQSLIVFLLEFYILKGWAVRHYKFDIESYVLGHIVLGFYYHFLWYIAVVSAYYIISRKPWFNTWPKQFWFGFIMVTALYLIYSHYEEPLMIKITQWGETRRIINYTFIRHLIAYLIVGISLPILVRYMRHWGATVILGTLLILWIAYRH